MPSEWMKRGADIEKTLFSDKHGKLRIFPPNLKVMLKVRGTETESGESTDGKASEQAKIRVVLKKLRSFRRETKMQTDHFPEPPSGPR